MAEKTPDELKICESCAMAVMSMREPEKLFCNEDGKEVHDGDNCRFNPCRWKQVSLS